VRKSIPYFSLKSLAQRKVPLGVRVVAGIFAFLQKFIKNSQEKKENRK
jgi:hypothetical protein